MRELQLLLFILVAVLAVIVSCDTTNSDFDESIPEVYSLTTQVVPQGGGKVQPDLGKFKVNETFDIEAIPAEGYVFERWEGDLTGNTNPESIVIDDDKNITARFSLRNYPLKIIISGEGSVIEVIESRSSEDENIQDSHQKVMSGHLQIEGDSLTFSQIRAGAVTQKQRVNPKLQSTTSATVRLKAVPEEGWYFDQWEGDLTGNVNPEVITVDDEKNVTAVFLQEDTEGFSIRINIIGEGEVNKNPDRAFFNDGDAITLTANPDQGWSFIEWQGDLSGSENSKTVIIEESLNVTALFEETDDPAMKINRQPSGTRAGNAISPAPKIMLTDGLGNPLQGVNISVSLNDNSFTTESDTTARTDGDGVATFDKLIIETAFPDYILTFDADEPDVSNISSNPFGVVSALGDPSNSSAKVPDGVAGAETVISITVQDRYGNVITDSADQIVVEISGANSETPSISEMTSPSEYSTNYTPVNTGIDKVSIELDGVPIDGSPFESDVTSANADASNSTATVPDGRAGEVTTISILLKDRFGNLVSNAAGQLSVEVGGANSASPGVSETNSPGKYRARYTPETIGTDRVSIQIGNEPIDDSPFDSDIAAASADPSITVVSAEPNVLTVGDISVITVQLRDRFENPIGGLAENDFEISFTGDASVGTISETSTSGNYEFEVTTTTSGVVNLSVSATGVTLNDTPAVTFEPGEPDELVIITQPENTRSGERIAGPPTVQVMDEFGNVIPGVDVSVKEESRVQFVEGSLTVTTNQSGIATFDNLVINRILGSFRLVFSVEGIPDAISVDFQVNPFLP